MSKESSLKDDASERVREALKLVKIGWEARPERHLTPHEKIARNAQREIVNLVEAALDARL